MEYHLFEEEQFDEEDTLENQYLFFSVDREVYGVELAYVVEIIGMLEMTHVPRLPGYMKGIINVRGTIIPVMDLRIRFQKQSLEYSGRNSIIIIQFQENTIGLIVDRAIEVGAVLPDEILPPPELVTGYHNAFVRGVSKADEKIKLLLDCDKLLTKDEIREISESL